MAEASAVAANRFELRRMRSRAAIVEAALELFQAKGIRATKLEEVCERADVALRTFFNHFETREHLYQAIGEQRAAQLAALVDAQTQDPRPFDQRLRQLIAWISGYVSARPAYRELVGEMLQLRVDAGNQLMRGGSLGRAVARLIADGVARGEITKRHRPEVLADLLLGGISTALINWSGSDDYDLNKGLEQTVDALLDLFALPSTVIPNPGGGHFDGREDDR